MAKTDGYVQVLCGREKLLFPWLLRVIFQGVHYRWNDSGDFSDCRNDNVMLLTALPFLYHTAQVKQLNENRGRTEGNVVLYFHIYLTHTWSELGRAGQKHVKWEGKDTKTFQGDTSLGHWINHVSDSPDQRCCEPHVCLPRSLLHLLWGRHGSCWCAAGATLCIHCQSSSAGLWSGRTLKSGSSASAAFLWALFGCLVTRHLCTLSWKQEREASPEAWL